MFDCSLDYPDQPWWHAEDNYNRNVAILLYQADIEIRKRDHSAEAYRNAMRIIQGWRDEKISLRQRMRIYYLIARANDAIGLTDKGIESVDHALSLAFALKSEFDVSKLLYHRARMNRSELFFARAAEDARDCMRIIDEHAPELVVESVTSVRLQLLPQLATYEFYLSDINSVLALDVCGVVWATSGTAWSSGSVRAAVGGRHNEQTARLPDLRWWRNAG